MKIKNKYTGKVITGYFEEICDYDKRIWIIENEEIKPVKIKTGLCILFDNFFGFDYLYHDIYSLKDLEGYYL
jgi:hypothetical protein